MRDPILLPGEGFGSSLYARIPRPRPSRWLRLLITVWLIGGLGFFLIRTFSSHRDAQQPSTPLMKSKITAISTEDIRFHINAVASEIEEAAQKIRRADDQIIRTLPTIDRNYLLVEKQHLNSALAAVDAARRALEQARQHADLVVNSIEKEHEQ